MAGQDLEYSARQLTEVAARALSPGTNDPVTAIDVLDRFGDALCSLRDRRWPDGQHGHEGELRLVMPATDFAGLLDTMFHMIRQYGRVQPRRDDPHAGGHRAHRRFAWTIQNGVRPCGATPTSPWKTPCAPPKTRATGPTSRRAMPGRCVSWAQG